MFPTNDRTQRATLGRKRQTWQKVKTTKLKCPNNYTIFLNLVCPSIKLRNNQVYQWLNNPIRRAFICVWMGVMEGEGDGGGSKMDALWGCYHFSGPLPNIMDVAHCHLDFPSTPKQINPTNDHSKKKREPKSDRRKKYSPSIKVGILTKQIAQIQSDPIILITLFRFSLCFGHIYARNYIPMQEQTHLLL